MKGKSQKRSYEQFLSQYEIGKLLLSLPASTLNQFNNLQSLKQAKNLYLCQKNIRDMPDLRELPNLQTLWINSNMLTDVGRVLDNVPNIRQIYLNNNHIQSLQGYQKCNKLQKINLANNTISKIPKTLSLPASLKSLILTRNKISSVEELTYIEMPLLQNLYLCYNQLTTAKILRRLNCPSLKNVYLHNNKISDFHGYDQILMRQGGMIDLVDLQQTREDKNITKLKLGIILGPRYRSRVNQIYFC